MNCIYIALLSNPFTHTHTHTHTQVGLTIRSNLGFSVLPKDTVDRRNCHPCDKRTTPNKTSVSDWLLKCEIPLSVNVWYIYMNRQLILLLAWSEQTASLSQAEQAISIYCIRLNLYWPHFPFNFHTSIFRPLCTSLHSFICSSSFSTYLIPYASNIFLHPLLFTEISQNIFSFVVVAREVMDEMKRPCWSLIHDL